MKINNIKVAISSLMIIVLFVIFNAPVQAFSIDIKQAGNACFPRTFSQLDFFKMSNGGLRNNSTTPKSVVCSFDIGFDDSIHSSIDTLSYWIIGDDLVEDMSCVFQIRDISAGNTAIISEAVLIDANGGDVFSHISTFDLSALPTPITIFIQHHFYVQCALPAQGRITSVIGVYE